MLHPLISQAKKWGFICHFQESKLWLILPQQSNQRWNLQQNEDRWILIVGNVPQLRLYTSEAIAFLQARWLENN
ncbi:MAG: hypothetical protein ACRC2S_26045 [Waterburya sp.]